MMTSVQPIPPTPLDGRRPDDVQRIGPGSTSPPPPKQGSAADRTPDVVPPAPKVVGPSTPAGRPAVKPNQATPPNNDPVRTALDNWRDAVLDSNEAEAKLVEATKRSDDAKEVAGQKRLLVFQAVYVTIIKSCGSGECAFASMRSAATKIDESVRAGSGGKEAIGRQFVIRQAIYGALLDGARDGLTSLANSRPVTQVVRNTDKTSTPKTNKTFTPVENKKIDDIASWVVEKQDVPRYGENYSRLKVLIEGLTNIAKNNLKKKDAAMAVAQTLVTACQDKGMKFTGDQRQEIEKSGLTVHD